MYVNPYTRAVTRRHTSNGGGPWQSTYSRFAIVCVAAAEKVASLSQMRKRCAVAKEVQEMVAVQTRGAARIGAGIEAVQRTVVEMTSGLDERAAMRRLRIEGSA